VFVFKVFSEDSKIEGFHAFSCSSEYNHYLTCAFLQYQLLKNCESAQDDLPFYEERAFVRNRIIFTLEKFPEGNQTIWMRAYQLRSAQKYGFLIDFHFRKNSDVPFNKRVQKLSLSLDKYGRENKNFYSDRYDKVQGFLLKYFNNIFPLSYEENQIRIAQKLFNFSAESLDTKSYVFGNDQTDKSQFIGLKRNTPLASLDEEPTVFFIYRQQDRLISLDLYKALRGETFPNIFPGTEKMFGFKLTSKNVKGIPVQNFKKEEIERVCENIKGSSTSPHLAILITPWSEYELDYYRAKHAFVNAKIPSQVVRLYTLQNESRLKWATSNIALQSFAKLGGKPWKVQPRHNRCMIVGIGQSHRRESSFGKHKIKRYYAYSVLTDSSGIFKELRILGRSNNVDEYLSQLKNSVIGIINDFQIDFDRFVVHAPYRIRGDELDSIRDVFTSYNDDKEKQFVMLRVNTKNDFFGYSKSNNSLVPFESSMISLAWDEYLVWFEGLQYHNPKVNRRYSRPVYISFDYYSTKLSDDDMLDYIQDAINLSGANWRGFNAKNMPVSIYYAQLIARFTNRFDELGLPEIDVDNLNPWFL
jgi:hypothetical protein